jgi:repressor of nif and glnA expression
LRDARVALALEQDHPLSSADIHAQLQQRGHKIALTATRAMLREHPSFMAVSGHGFQLGRYFGAQA